MRIYVAGPYTKGDVVENVRNAIVIGHHLRRLGHLPYVPHLSHFWHFLIPQKIEYWYKLDMEWLEVCEAVFRIGGESTGADMEVQRAQELGLPVFYSLEDLQRYQDNKNPS